LFLGRFEDVAFARSTRECIALREAAHGDAVAAGLRRKTVGLGSLQAKMAQNLVPTLMESFGLTMGSSFTTFFLVFRSDMARLMTMIPALAILVMFGVMRVSGMPPQRGDDPHRLDGALGTSENDQIHDAITSSRRKDGHGREALAFTRPRPQSS
jgi:hypothetical protein